MVSVDQLCCLDGLIWLQSGHAVGALTRQHQTTVSRNQKKCAKTFDVHVLKRDGLWQVEGDTQLLQLERGVHQAARLKAGQGLRLEATFEAATALPSDITEAWSIGTSRIQAHRHFTSLLEQRVIEAWLTCSDAPVQVSGDLTTIPLDQQTGASGLVVRRDLHEEGALQALINSLLAQQQCFRDPAS